MVIIKGISRIEVIKLELGEELSISNGELIFYSITGQVKRPRKRLSDIKEIIVDGITIYNSEYTVNEYR